MNPKGVYVNLATRIKRRPNVVYTSTKIKKIKLIAYIYIRFNQNMDNKSYISAKIEAVKHLHTVFLLLAEQR